MSGRLRPKEGMDMNKVPSTPAIRYPDDEFFTGARTLKNY
jgi:hypothetical protein